VKVLVLSVHFAVSMKLATVKVVPADIVGIFKLSISFMFNVFSRFSLVSY